VFGRRGIIELTSDTSYPTIIVSLTVEQWVNRYNYAVAKSHRYDSAWMLGSLLGIDIADDWNDPCETEEFRQKLIEKYDSSPTKVTEIKE